MNVHKKIVAVTALCMSLFMGACGGAKLSTANEQMERGEYFDASKTYRKIYNKLTKREERELRGEVAFKTREVKVFKNHPCVGKGVCCGAHCDTLQLPQ